ncbi:MAG: Fumarylpyruvate hydrolase [Steroidobacteraceae bacterium]|nr:Fumarylpyruvate hydrolase [Steroidobacteraceae bacterium]
MSQFIIPPPPRIAIPVAGRDALFPVRRIYCVGRNYAAHAREMGNDSREPPFFFQKPTDAVVASGSTIAYPPETRNLHHEVELVLGIGLGGADISPQEARRHVIGLAVGIDLTRRDLQNAAKEAGRPWECSKSFDASAPISALVEWPAGEPLPQSGRITLSVNGQRRQEGNLVEMTWSCTEIVAQLSRFFRLAPGDLIFTGTPAGVGPVVAGDWVQGEIEGVGVVTVLVN